MLKILAIAAGVVVVLVVAVVIYAATRPDEFRIERTARIKAAPDKIQAHLTDFKAWRGWSPWEALDPALTRQYSGAATGKGAVYAWEGNGKVGAGRMEILDAPPGKVVIKLDFIKPFEGHNTAEFTLTPDGDGTRVTWAMFGARPLMAKVMCLFMDMDKMVGGSFETGLASLKGLAEAA
jgi:hypothetical protein